MLEEIKMILDAVDDVAGLGLWALIGFVAYKLIIYMSTTGAIVFCVKLIVEKLHDSATKEKKITWDLDGIAIDGFTKVKLASVLLLVHGRSRSRSLGGLRYLHEDDVEWISSAIKEKLEREPKK